MRISGVPVGKVKSIEPDNTTGRSDVTIELKTRYAPLPSDARAILRQKTLLGETYVELTPGTRTLRSVAEGGSLPDGAGLRRPSSSTRSSARSTSPRARRSMIWMQEQAAASAGRGRDLNDALGNLAPFAEDSARLVDILNRQQGAVTQPDLQHGRGVRRAERARRPARGR